jgi:hypothetical protein
MAKKKDIHLKALVDAVESGVPRRDIMKRFGFNSPAQVTTYYLDELVEAGRAEAIVGRVPKATQEKAETVKVTHNPKKTGYRLYGYLLPTGLNKSVIYEKFNGSS